MAKMSGRWLMKSCPSCGGDMYIDYDPRSTDLRCLQCGRAFARRTPEEKVALREEVEHGRKVRLPA